MAQYNYASLVIVKNDISKGLRKINTAQPQCIYDSCVTRGQREAALCTTSADCLAGISRIQCTHRAHTPGRPWKIYTLLLGQVLLHWCYKQDGPNGNWVLGFNLGFTRSETS